MKDDEPTEIIRVKVKAIKTRIKATKLRQKMIMTKSLIRIRATGKKATKKTTKANRVLRITMTRKTNNLTRRVVGPTGIITAKEELVQEGTIATKDDRQGMATKLDEVIITMMKMAEAVAVAIAMMIRR